MRKKEKSRLKNKLTKLYSGLDGPNPVTFVDLSLGDLRSIEVSIVGEVGIPGNYTLSAFSNVFNALYASRGINDNGSLRGIKVFRQNKLIAELDAYDFLINGNTGPNIRLETNDVILVGTYTKRVFISGAVKRPGTYELKDKESLKDLIFYAGGFSETAFSDQIRVVRNSNEERVIANVFKSQYEIFQPNSGDEYEVQRILNRFSNRVQIKGAVFRPGMYSLQDGLTVKKLIEQAVKSNSYAKAKAYLARYNGLSSDDNLKLMLRQKILLAEKAYL